MQEIELILELHSNAGRSQGHDKETGKYGWIENCCKTCGTFGEYGEPWPCETYNLAVKAQL